ncbi:MAG: GTP cyclohydrolase 1 type 2 [Deltaproteobacteria bacterium ADurb.BinA179]|jgi:dinuclear metal center YbgI/SA1388 family protein|nr:Nif3-like dinuclear metal center hexameric protein [Deltaproteobacteria bacterium]MDX9762640.1 Nif3-like dinuclear metal center hexameric protein [Desulfomonilia bacterium]OPZ25685.1 MAG: GTP cyclohydrolase 1 type 2 [Deltaproteobacteria bacterium ADurb.BinA179]HPW69215.1 Nif3-like dinuclear metal center hexameric protein [Deltaproteobacteria bacterium]
MRLKDLLTVLESIAPFDTAEPWDNTGLMVGHTLREVRSVLVALDPSTEVIQEAEKLGADLIITHHPLIFTPLKRLDLQESIPRRVARLIQASMALVSMHTNLDAARGGVADELADRLCLKEVQRLKVLRIGKVEQPCDLRAWVARLPFETVRIVDGGRPVENVCACPGSGMDYLGEAIGRGCDTLVTGDVRYHAGLDAKEAGVNVVDLGHFATEEIIIAPLAKRLGSLLPGVTVRAYGAKDVFMQIKGENH